MSVVLGLWASSRDRLAGQLAAEVHQLATERELRVAAARLAERTALAAEMHDVLAHPAEFPSRLISLQPVSSS